MSPSLDIQCNRLPVNVLTKICIPPLDRRMHGSNTKCNGRLLGVGSTPSKSIKLIIREGVSNPSLAGEQRQMQTQHQVKRSQGWLLLDVLMFIKFVTFIEQYGASTFELVPRNNRTSINNGFLTKIAEVPARTPVHNRGPPQGCLHRLYTLRLPGTWNPPEGTQAKQIHCAN